MSDQKKDTHPAQDAKKDGVVIPAQHSALIHSLPEDMMAHLRNCPRDRPVILLMRHSIRGPLPKSGGDEVPLTDEGRNLARQFGGQIARAEPPCLLASVHSSPVLRCRQTAQEIMNGADRVFPPDPMPCLSLPGIFLLDSGAAVNAWRELGGDEVLRRMSLEVPLPLPGMTPVESAVAAVLIQMFSKTDNLPGLHVFVTHDAIVLPVAARLLGQELSMKDWPAFLDGIFIWNDDQGNIRSLYQKNAGCRPADRILHPASPKLQP